MSLDYWSAVLAKNEFKMRACRVYYTKGTGCRKANGKMIRYLDAKGDIIAEGQPPPTSSVEVSGYELELAMRSNQSSVIVIDVDAAVKADQNLVLSRLETYCRAKRSMYSERTPSNGVHIVLRVAGLVEFVRERVDVKIEGMPTTFMVEFKRRCLVWPTARYEPINKPIRLATYTSAEFYTMLTEIASLLSNENAHVDHIDWGTSVIVEPLASSSLVPVSDDEEGGDVSNEQIWSSELHGGSLITPAVGGGNDLEGEEAAEGLLVGNKRKRAPPKTAASRKKKSLTMQAAQEAVKRIVDDGGQVSELDVASFDQEDDSSSEFHSKSFIEGKFKKILENIDSLGHEFKGAAQVSYIRALQSTVSALHNYISQQANSPHVNLYGEHVRTFIEYMSLADVDLTKVGRRASGIFCTLRSKPLWKIWSFHYCHLMVTLENNHQQMAGRNSRLVRFDDYKLYREVTITNDEGYALTEDAASAEYYNDIKRPVYNLVRNIYKNCWHKFLEFILTTLATVNLNSKVVSRFVTYVNYLIKNHEVDLYLDILLGVKLQGGAKIEYIIEENETNKFDPVALVYFKNQHWVPVNTDFFRCFITNCFPNLASPDALIKALCSQNHSKLYNEKRETAFMCWVNQIPFKNGLFDFEYLRKLLDAANESPLNENGKRCSPTASGGARKRRKICDFSIEGEEAANNDGRKLTERALPIFDVLKNEHGAGFTREDLTKYSNISVFRNYSENDAVLSPIDKSISIDFYLSTFFSTPLLSLENYTRYSKAFCIYMRCLMGNNAHEGLMGPFQYMRNFVLFAFLGQSFMRTKIFQKSINFIGRGSNGKSQFMEVLAKIFGDKFVYVTLKMFFNDSNELSQQGQGISEAFSIYDAEADVIPSRVAFKSFVTEEVKIPRRKLYRTIDRRERQHQSLIVASNFPISYKNALQESVFDWAFGRRVLLLPFYNTLGMRASEDEVAYESLFKTQGFNIKSSRVKQEIYRGMLFYILDAVHMWDLGNVNSSSNDYLDNSLANRRLIGKGNNLFVSTLFDKYVPMDEIYSTEDEINLHADAPVDLAQFFFEHMNPSHLKYTSLGAVVDSLEDWFGLRVEYCLSSDSADPKNPWRADVGKFMLTGVKLKSNLSAEQRKLWVSPNVNYPVAGSNFDDMYLNIPLAHRFKFNESELTNKIHETVFKTLKIDKLMREGGRVSESDFTIPLQKPIKHPMWASTELSDVLEGAN